MSGIFFDITIIVVLATALSILFRFLKQPAVLAYILAGILIGPLALLPIHGEEEIHALGDIGITLLLFMLGLELRFKDLRSVGRVALLTGIGQIVFTSILGYLLAVVLGFSPLTSLYICIALTFSSTIIIVKLLSDKKDLNSLYGKISIGFLLVQDFVAIIALIILSGFSTGGASSLSLASFGFIMVKAALLFGVVVFLSKTILPRLVSYVAKSSEVLFLASLAWAFGIASLVSSEYVGFSIEIGGFLAGLALANTSENFHIISKVRSLRDFFITIFFVTLGMGMVFANMLAVWFPALIFSLFVLVGNPLIVMAILGRMGYRLRTSFMAGLTVAQISEFSFIVIVLGGKIGHVSETALSLITLVGAVTFVASTYMIMNAGVLYKLFSPYLGFFERSSARNKNIPTVNLKDHVILIGAHRLGSGLLEALESAHEDVLVVDFDPEIIDKLKEKGTNCLFGDIADQDIQERAGVDKARIIISTIPDIDDTLHLVRAVKKSNSKAKIIVMALEAMDAKALYKEGVDYVVLPHLAGGRHLAKIIVDNKHLELIEDYKARDLAAL